MKINSFSSSGQENYSADDRRGATPFEVGSAAAGCTFGCIREIIVIGILLIVGYVLLANCTGMV